MKQLKVNDNKESVFKTFLVKILFILLQIQSYHCFLWSIFSYVSARLLFLKHMNLLTNLPLSY